MRFAAASGFVLLLALVAPVRAVPAQRPSFLGEWTATASTPGGDVSETVTAVQIDKGYAITVQPVVSPPEGSPEAGPGTDIVLDGDKFSYKRLLITPGGTLVITYPFVATRECAAGCAASRGARQRAHNGRGRDSDRATPGTTHSRRRAANRQPWRTAWRSSGRFRRCRSNSAPR